MRLTVGPLPSAVYWRRRALVLGGMLVVIILLVYSCSDPESDAKSSDTGATSTAGATSAPPGGDAAGAESDASPTPSTSAGRAASPTAAPDRSLCTDSELRVTPVPTARRLARGADTQITLKIKNTSDRTCKRDVGPDQQELYIVEQGGAEKVWSSDDCGGPRGTSVKSFTPGFERAYTANWNGRESTDCKDRPLPRAGTYQLYGRLGTKRSDPVTLTLT